MNEIDIKKKAEELERTLQLQLAQLKKDSQLWVKVGGAALAIGLIATVVVKGGKMKNKKSAKLKDATYEPIHKIKKNKKRKAKTSSFFTPIRNRLFLALFSLGQARLMEELKKRKENFNEG